MGTYTEQRENDLFSSWQWNDINDYTQVRSVLDTHFRSFGEGLVDIMQEKAGFAIEEPMQYMCDRAAQQGVPLSAIASTNTLKSWFSGGPRPKKGEASRRSIFAIAFALELSPEETAALFHKVYLDRAFDLRDPVDIVAYYCLSKHYQWDRFEAFIANLPSGEETDRTVYTSVLRDQISNIESDSALIHFLATHQHNLSKRNVSAKASLERLLEKANTFAQNEANIYWGLEQFEGSDRTSRSFTYEVIVGVSPSGKKGTVSVFKNADLPKEIKSRFPEAASFSKKDPTYEELRKMIILLYSYCFWYQVQHMHEEIDLDDYIAEMNAVLNECGFSELYMGNPFDWMFLYCTLEDNPLDTFRGLLAEALEQDN